MEKSKIQNIKTIIKFNILSICYKIISKSRSILLTSKCFVIVLKMLNSDDLSMIMCFV